MSWRASLAPRFTEVRFFVCRNSPKSLGALQYLTAERSELLMLNPSLRIPITQRYASDEAHYPARIKFYTADHKGGELVVDGLSKAEIEGKLKTLFEAIRDDKPQGVVNIAPLLQPGEDWKGDLINYFRKQVGPIRKQYE